MVTDEVIRGALAGRDDRHGRDRARTPRARGRRLRQRHGRHRRVRRSRHRTRRAPVVRRRSAAARRRRRRPGPPRTGEGTSGSDPRRPTPSAYDPEELRYAPRPPSRMRWLRWAAALVLVALILAAGGAWAYNWSQKQYFVAAHDGKVAIFKGVQADIPGITLQHVEQVTEVDLDSAAGVPSPAGRGRHRGIEQGRCREDRRRARPARRSSRPRRRRPAKPTKTTKSTASNTSWQR